MEEDERYRRRLKVRHDALRRLKATNIHCICGEADPVCFEADHIYRQDLDGACWAICKNCHAKRSARGWSEQPPVRPGPHDPRERLAHLLLGASDYQEFIAGHLRQAAISLLNELENSTTE